MLITDTQIISRGLGGGAVAWAECRALYELGALESVIGKAAKMGDTLSEFYDYQKSFANKDVPGIRFYDNMLESYGIQPMGDVKDGYARDMISSALMDQDIKRYGRPNFLFTNGSPFYQCTYRAKLMNCKVIADIPAHDLKESIKEFQLVTPDHRYPFENQYFNPVLAEMQLYHIMQADLVLLPSEIARQNILHSVPYLEHKLDPNRLQVCPHGTFLPPVDRKIPERKDKRFTVLYGGAFGPDKGVSYLIQAWVNCKFTKNEARLVLFGEQSKQLEPAMNNLPIKNIECLGRLTNDQLSDQYDLCDWYCQPSVSESFGIEILEALSHGKPTIVSTGAGASEVIKKGVNGMTFGPRDVGTLMTCLEQAKDIAKNPDEYAKYSRNARETAEKYTWDITVAKLKELLKPLVN